MYRGKNQDYYIVDHAEITYLYCLVGEVFSNMPYLVRLLMLTPVPMSNVTMSLNSISIASLLIGKGMAKEIAVPEQVTMILKSMEDMGDFMFSLGPSKSSGVEIKELSESHIEESVAHADLAVKDESLGLKTNEVETAAGVEVAETSRDDTLLSPRSECSDTESQHELIVKVVEKVDSNQPVKDIGANLPGINEEGETDQHSPYFCQKLKGCRKICLLLQFSLVF